MTQGCRIHHQMAQDLSWLNFKDQKKLGNNKEEEEEAEAAAASSSSTCTSSIGEESMDGNSDGSYSISSSEDTADDASSSNSYDLSEIMAQLPIKRGLSKFYQGKSESFTCLARVRSSEDLAKKTSPYRRNYYNKLKASKSCGTGLNSYKPYTLPKPVITKKSTRVSSFSSSSSPFGGGTKRGSFLISSKPPMVPLHKIFDC